MRDIAHRFAAVSAVTCMALAPAVMTPPAAAVTPPAIDNTLLPSPGSPAPPRPTEQARPCVTGTIGSPGSAGQLADVDLQSVWALSRGAGQTVAVIDTGVARHRLLPRLIPGGDYVSSGDGTDDCDGHGTVVAGIIGAAPAEGPEPQFSGVAPEATLIGIRQSSNRFRAVDAPAGTEGFGDVDTLASAVRTAADMGATVINISTIACVPAESALDDGALGAALAYAVDVKNVVVVAAAGNVGAPGQCPDRNPGADPSAAARPDWTEVNVVVSPAWYDDYVLTVGSVGDDGAPSSFTLAGPWVDVAAPGERVVSLDADGEGLIDTMPTTTDEKPIAGTSYAAPVVSGVVALLRSRSPELTARQVMQRIEDTARQPAGGWNPVVGHGVIDIHAAVSGSAAARRSANQDESQTVSRPDPDKPDRHPAGLATTGAAVCLVVSLVVGLTTSSGRRLRH